MFSIFSIVCDQNFLTFLCHRPTLILLETAVVSFRAGAETEFGDVTPPRAGFSGPTMRD